MGTGLPSITLPQPKDAITDPDVPVPAIEFNLTELLGKAFAAVPLEEAFRRVEATRDPLTGVATLTLSGISEPVLNVLEGLLTALPGEDGGTAKDKGYDKKIARALVSLLREQADTAITLTLTADSSLAITQSTAVTALDLTSLPQLTANMPVEIRITTDVKLNRENISIQEPEDADRYEEVPLYELHPPEEETA